MQTNKYLWRLFLAAGLLFALLIPTASAFGGNPNPRIIPPNAHPYGKTYGEWSAVWEQWALGQPKSTDPVSDTTGEHCGAGQSGPVWFLAGTGDWSKPVERDCTIPTGKAILIPVANGWCSPPYGVEPPVPSSICPNTAMDNVSSMSATVDDWTVKDLQAYRVLSPSFTFTLPEDNVLGAPPGDYPDAISAGFYLMITPLTPGQHTLHVVANFESYWNPWDGYQTKAGTLDVTYRLTIAPHGKNIVGKNMDR